MAMCYWYTLLDVLQNDDDKVLGIYTCEFAGCIGRLKSNSRRREGNGGRIVEHQKPCFRAKNERIRNSAENEAEQLYEAVSNLMHFYEFWPCQQPASW